MNAFFSALASFALAASAGLGLQYYADGDTHSTAGQNTVATVNLDGGVNGNADVSAAQTSTQPEPTPEPQPADGQPAATVIPTQSQTNADVGAQLSVQTGSQTDATVQSEAAANVNTGAAVTLPAVRSGLLSIGL